VDKGDWLGLATLLAFVAFLAVCFWAYSGKQKKAFDEAAQLPFADDDMSGTNKGRSDD